jgi:hypothetical protein
MIRAAILSFAVAFLVASPGCEKKATNVPDAASEEEADNAPPEEDELEGVGVEEEEEAPNLSRRRDGDGA